VEGTVGVMRVSCDCASLLSNRTRPDCCPEAVVSSVSMDLSSADAMC